MCALQFTYNLPKLALVGVYIESVARRSSWLLASVFYVGPLYGVFAPPVWIFTSHSDVILLDQSTKNQPAIRRQLNLFLGHILG